METLLQLFAPWAGFVSHHHAVGATLVGLHLMALLIGGGLGDRGGLECVAGEAR
ncbi:MAG: hypothetical protein LBG44_04750 [Gemmatimonadota bacterium]|jgi:hypothetical protein|nr:hypothetical protein [Gemmatimonadota bacterium]